MPGSAYRLIIVGTFHNVPGRHGQGVKTRPQLENSREATQAIVRSPGVRGLRSVGASSTESPPKRHIDSQQAAFLDENPAIAVQD
jgi:hypothetical protein